MKTVEVILSGAFKSVNEAVNQVVSAKHLL